MADGTRGLKIGELAQRAGVNRGTIQHYLREGLLPQPIKTHRNMAYYDPACVERIQLIKELQRRHFLPLSIIKDVLKRVDAGEGPVVLRAQQAVLERVDDTEGEGVTLEEAATRFQVDAAFLERMEEAGFATRRPHGERRCFSGADLEVLDAMHTLGTLGLGFGSGFSMSDLTMYKRAAEQLLSNEIASFFRVIVGTLPPEEVVRLAQEAVEGATLLFVALRKKLLLDLLRSGRFSELAKSPGAAARRADNESDSGAETTSDEPYGSEGSEDSGESD